MLSEKDNQDMTEVGPGTIMGALMRQYWLPFYLSTDLEREGRPERVRLLGEDLVVFRDTAGDVGLVREQCAHRGASLFYARNEECGLRCVFHAWKFTTDGACIDMPNEPPESSFKARVRQPAYPCRERNGIIWTYMGPELPPPALPMLEWNNLPSSHVFLHQPRVQETNYMSALEGEYDSSHAVILHDGLLGAKSAGDGIRAKKPFPKYYTAETDYGVLIAARYPEASPDEDYWRVYPFMMPFHMIVNLTMEDGSALYTGHSYAPMDDAHTFAIAFSFHPTRPLTERERAIFESGLPFRPGLEAGIEGFHPTPESFLPPHNGPYGKYWPKLNASNDWGFDYEAQRKTRWSGIAGVWPQDVAVQHGWGPIVDRTQEHLGTNDVGAIAMRGRLLRSARALRDRNETPPGAHSPEVFAIRPTHTLLPRDVTSWENHIAPLLEVPGTPADPPLQPADSRN